MRRRDFFKKSAAAALGLGLMGAFPVPGYSKIKGANGKLNIAQVGVAGMQGDFHLTGSASENRFALCDVDTALLDPVCEKNPGAKRFVDWRDMLDQRSGRRDHRLDSGSRSCAGFVRGDAARNPLLLRKAFGSYCLRDSCNAENRERKGPCHSDGDANSRRVELSPGR